MIEGLSDSAKTVLSADDTRMQNDAHAMGHPPITFLFVRVWTDILRLLEEAGPASSYSPEDVLDIHGTMKKFEGYA